MKCLGWFILACLGLGPRIVDAAQIAQARLYCVSVRLAEGRDEYGDVLNVTSTGALDGGRGDLAPWQAPGSELQLPGGESYISNISLYDPASSTYGGSIAIAIQPPTDSNSNRFPDFFEVSKGVDLVRPYGVVNVTGYGQVDGVKVTWYRTAGSKSGTCLIALADGYFGTFRHVFEIMEYTGTLTYTPGTNAVSGTLNLVQTGNAANSVQAPVQFLKSSANGYNELTLQPGVCSGTLLSTVHSFTNHVFTRDDAWPTNYAGYVEFSDGDTFTFEPYANWVLSITDSNDTDRDGIPDFSDDPPPPPRPAGLALSIGSGNLELTIHGDLGRSYEIQATPSLKSPNWQFVQTAILSSDPQTITLPLPSETRFWRAVAQ